MPSTTSKVKKFKNNTINQSTISLSGKVGLFVDAANVLYSQKTLNWEIDYKKVITYFRKHSELISAHFYSGIVSTNKKQSAFFEKMATFGYDVTTKGVKWIKSKQEKIVKGKGNLDIELALDVCQKFGKFDTIALFSGDSDFQPLVKF